MNKILNAREARSKLINSKLNNSNIIIIKTNTVGSNKNPYYAYLVCNVFFEKIKKVIKIERFCFQNTYDGPFYLLETLEDVVEIKKELIALENEHPLGRLADLDVYSKDLIISRRDLGLGFRKCLVCDDFAIKCMKTSKHSIDEITNTSNKIVRTYLERTIRKFVDTAITKEATLDPKFGLVTINSNGSHLDMDFNLLMKSKEAILDDLVEMFFLGFDNDLLDGFYLARRLGIKTETKMFKVTNNINTYKGLIFILGIVLVCLGNSIKNNEINLFEKIKLIGRDLNLEFSNNLNTFGQFAYQKYGFLGARGEVSNGLENVRLAKTFLKDISDESLTLTLIYLIKNVEDTVLLKRSGSLEKYNYFKNLVGSINKYDKDIIFEVTNKCIKDNISFGGSADLLVASIFISLIEKETGIIYE